MKEWVVLGMEPAVENIVSVLYPRKGYLTILNLNNVFIFYFSKHIFFLTIVVELLLVLQLLKALQLGKCLDEAVE